MHKLIERGLILFILTISLSILGANNALAKNPKINYSALRMQANFVQAHASRSTVNYKKQYFKTIKEILGTDIKANKYFEEFKKIKFITGVKAHSHFWFQYASNGKSVKVEFFPSGKKNTHAFKINGKSFTYDMEKENLATLFKKMRDAHKTTDLHISPISNAYADGFGFSWDDVLNAVSSISIPSIKGRPMTNNDTQLGGNFCCEIVDEANEVFNKMKKDSARCLADLTDITSANPKAQSSEEDDSYFGMFDTVLSYIMDSEEEDFLNSVHDSNTKFTALQAYQSVDKHILNTCKTKSNNYNPLNDPEENEQVVNNPTCSEKFNKHNNIMTSLNFYMESLRDCLKITQDKTRILNDESFRNSQASQTLQKINNSSMKYAGKYEKMALEEDGVKIQPEVIRED